MSATTNPYKAPDLRTGDLPNRSGKLIILELNGLRGIAILSVIYFHTFFVWFSNTTYKVFGIWLNPYIVSGWHGVNLFFVLSAFVLFLPYVAGERDMSARGSVWRFYRHRAWRLLPTYYLIIVAEMAFSGYSPFSNAVNTRATLSALSFTFSFMPDMWTPAAVNLSAWSLGTEVLFSAAFPLLCWLCLRFGAVRILAVSIPVGVLFRLWGYSLAPPEPISWMEGMLVGRIDEFLWGFFLAEAFVRGRIPKRPYLFWILGAIMFVLVQNAYAEIDHKKWFAHLLLATLVIAFDVAIALFMAAALAGHSWWSDFLNMRWLRVIGMACYSLYLWHYPLLYPLRVPFDPFNLPHLAAFLLLLCVLSAITYRFVEFRNVADWRALFLLNEPGRPSRLKRIVDVAHLPVKLASRVD